MELQPCSEIKIQKAWGRKFQIVVEALPSSLGVVVRVLDKADAVVPCMLNVHSSHTQQSFSVNHQFAFGGTIFLLRVS